MRVNTGAPPANSNVAGAMTRSSTSVGSPHFWQRKSASMVTPVAYSHSMVTATSLSHSALKIDAILMSAAGVTPKSA